MFEAIVITTFISIWTIERIYFYCNNKNNEPLLNLNTGVISSPINSLNTVNSLNVPLANRENAYYYTAPVYNLGNNKETNDDNKTENNTENNQNNNENNTINI